MGMFDSFWFAANQLPENPFPPEIEFQTKCLGQSLQKYKVDQYGHISGGEHIEAATINVYAYEQERVNGRAVGESKYIEYKIVIVDGRLRRAELTNKEGFE